MGHLGALALGAMCMLGIVLSNPFGALEFSTALVTSIFVYWHESSPAETTRIDDMLRLWSYAYIDLHQDRV